MGAVLPATIPVCGEGLPATGAGEAVVRFPVDLLRVGVPPCLPATGRAELDPLDAVPLDDGLPAAEADGRVIRNIFYGSGTVAGQAVPLTVAFDGADGDAERTGDGDIAVILLPEPADHGFLFIGHGISSSLRRLSLNTHWTNPAVVVRFFA